MNGQPKYLQVERDLLRQIEDGSLKPDDMLPSETELIAAYNVSRVTIRHALDDLASGGYIYRMQGKGTYVSKPNASGLSINEYRMSYIAELRLLGYDARRNIICSKLIVCDDELAQKEDLTPGECYFFFERFYDIDSVPFSYEKSYFLYRMVPGIEKHDLANESFNQILLEYGFDNVRITRMTTLRAVVADQELAHHMGTREGFPLISLTTRCEMRSDDGMTSERIEVSRAVSRTDTLPLIVSG